MILKFKFILNIFFVVYSLQANSNDLKCDSSVISTDSMRTTDDLILDRSEINSWQKVEQLYKELFTSETLYQELKDPLDPGFKDYLTVLGYKNSLNFDTQPTVPYFLNQANKLMKINYQHRASLEANEEDIEASIFSDRLTNTTSLRTHHIQDSDLIQLGFAFSNGKDWTCLKHGDLIPNGFNLMNQVPKGSTVVIPGKVLYDCLSKGIFPLMFGENLIHDLAHYYSFHKNLNYMKIYKAVSTWIKTNGGWPWLSNTSLFHRIYFFNESLETINAEALVNLPIYTNIITSHFSEKIVTSSQIYERFSEFTELELINLSKELAINVNDLFNSFGGASIDSYYSREGYSFKHQIKNLPRVFSFSVEGKRDNLFERLSDLIFTIETLKNYSLTEWANDLLTETPNKTSPVYKLLCDKNYISEYSFTHYFRKMQGMCLE